LAAKGRESKARVVSVVMPLGEKLCPSCGSALALRGGRRGAFWGCTAYPRCCVTLAANAVDICELGPQDTLNLSLIDYNCTSTAIELVELLPSHATELELTPTALTEDAVTCLLLRALLQHERKVGLVALENMGIDRSLLAQQLADILTNLDGRQQTTSGKFSTVLPSDIPPLLKRLLQQAEQEAVAMGHNYIGSEHLLLAIIRLGSPALVDLLKRHSITYDGAKVAIVNLLKG
jgi:hypothetical protein